MWVMVSRRNTSLIVSVAVLVILMAAAISAHAQNASNLSPYQSFLRTANTNLSVSTALVSGFNSTTMTCPATHTAGCTIRVQVSTQFSMSCCMQGNFRMKVSIPGSGSQMWPNSLVNVGMMGGGMMGYGNMFAHTFHWMKTGIPAGATQTVSIQFQTDAGSGTLGYRSAMVDLCLN
jgi:hypothetical protein